MKLSNVLNCLGCAALAFNGAVFAATTYYVAPTGSDNAPNDGSAGSPFREVRKALTLVQPGDTVLVADGQYKGFDVDNINGVAGSPITVQAQGTNAQVMVTTDRTDNRDTIFVTFSSYVVIDGFRSFNANRAAMRIDQSPHTTVRNCVFGDNSHWGIFTDFADDLLIEKNECYGSVIEHGIYVSNTCTRPIVRGNIIHDNHANGLHMNGDESQGGDGVITNALVENNIIYGNGKNGGGGSGINCDGVQNSVFRNNLIYAAHGAGITLYQIDAAAPSINATVINNTIDVASDGKWAIQIHNGSSGAVVFNNIFLTHHATRGSIHLFEPADQQGLICDYNIRTNTSRVATPDDDGTILTLAQWQALGFDAHSKQYTHDQLFVNTAGADFHLLPASPALNIGIGLLSGKNAPSSDLEAHSRPQNGGFDIGSFEMGTTGGGNNTAPSITSGPSALPNPAAVNQSVAFSIAASDAESDPLTYTWNFGDGASGTGAAPSHAYSTGGVFSVSVTVSDSALTASGSMNVTVQGTPGPGPGPGAPLVGAGLDGDGDGFSDGFEGAAGTSPSDVASTPIGGAPATAGTIQALALVRTRIGLNFAKAGSDSITFSGLISVTAGFTVLGKKVTLDVGGVAKSFTLDGKGAAKAGYDSIKASVKARRGVVSAQMAKLSVAFKKGSFAAALASSGLTGDADARNAPKTVVYSVVFNDSVLQNLRTLSYTVRRGKAGSAK